MKKFLLMAGVTLALAACSGQKGQDAAGENPFLSEYNTPFGVPPFDQIKPEHYKPALLQGMEEQKKEIEAIVNQRSMPDFENTIVALDRSGALLNKVAYVFYAQSAACADDEIQALSTEIAPLMAQHSDDINLNPRLFERVKQVYERKADFNLNHEQECLLEKTYRDFVRGGANLDSTRQARLRQLNGEISVLEQTFSQNMLKETNDFKLVIDKKEDLAGLPQALVDNAAATAKAQGMEGKWVFTLHNPSVMPFLQYADNRDLREKIFKGYTSRGNNNNDADNKQVVRSLMQKRLEKAQLMGYKDYAAYVLEDRMAKNSENVYGLLDAVWTPALDKAKEELNDIRAEIKKEGKDFEPEAWDWSYYFEKAKKAKFNFDENQLRPYLPLDQVREGVFYVANKLYGITFTQLKDIPLPHPDAMAFECKDKDGSHLGVLYMDFFPRASKGGGAWCTTYRDQGYDEEGKKITPVVSIVCNFTPAADGQPALLSADEATTLFHEFGHALQALFQDVHYRGTASVPRDFVELPSQINEHWAFEPEVLKVYAKHYKTGEVIPAELIDKLDKSGKYGQGFASVERVAASYVDMGAHVLTAVPDDLDVIKFESDLLNKRGLIKQIHPRYHITYFAHTMGGGYTAGYYGYMWAEVLDADAYQAFKESGDIFNQELAGKFRQYILTPGGIDDAMDMYKNFRGKEPATDALLHNRGLK